MQIILNFISNAIKFSERDQLITLRLKLLEIQDISKQNYDAQGNLILVNNRINDENFEKYAKFMIEIEDNGVGIS